ncbi:unnamed protein product [Periconia digitata]|uniref:Uncharacterized protein n=1 Tax=Periconia digitata TaxID=1303443 RepID=A0A9W4UBY3_9PLEO|nr:unnamed protein product [Periconia digitata]
MRHMQVKRHHEKIRNDDVRHIEDSVVPPSELAQSCGADCCEQSQSDETKDDILVLDTLCEEAGLDEEIHIECGVQSKQQENYPTQDLM